MTYRKKLIEVALPLVAINAESARRKRKAPGGYPTTLHKWWAQRPLAACRAITFATFVDDPGNDLPPKEAAKERKKLFKLIEELILWDNSQDSKLMARAYKEIQKSSRNGIPSLADPFCGGGSIPLEAHRLNIDVFASDLNPIAVVLTKSMTEIPSKFSGSSPVHPDVDSQRQISSRGWRNAEGIAEDVRYYGQLAAEEVYNKIGTLYPAVTIGKKGSEPAEVIAWLWARSVKCPNPACGAQMPLIKSFWLSTRKGKEVWVQPIIEKGGRVPSIVFGVKTGAPSESQKKANSEGSGYLGKGGKNTKGSFKCLACKQGPVDGGYIDDQASQGKLGTIPVAVYAKGPGGRFYTDVSDDQIKAVKQARRVLGQLSLEDLVPREPCRGTFASNAQGRSYGFAAFGDYFTTRQKVAMTSFCRAIIELGGRIEEDAKKAGFKDDGISLDMGGAGAKAYSEAISLYLSFALNRHADYGNSLCSWRAKDSAMRSLFSKQALSMVWDFAEGSPFGDSSTKFSKCVDVIAGCVEMLPASTCKTQIKQLDATAEKPEGERQVFITDPPYYSNISYADLSDFFYVWLRKTAGTIFPDIFSTMLVPKEQELIASPYRFSGDADAAKNYFEFGLVAAFREIQRKQNSEYPCVIFYAFKQSEDDESEPESDSGHSSTGWETMLEGLVKANLVIHGTWPIRTEGDNRSVGIGTNALASSIVLVCRPRPADAPMATRKEFIAALKKELPDALTKLQSESIAPVDLAQASIGPGMGVFSRYSKVLEADGSTMSVRTALQIINQELETYLTTQEGDLDKDTRFCVSWFEQYGMNEAKFGEADVLARAKNTSVDGLVEAGVFKAKAGKVRLLKRDELDDKWDPAKDKRLTVWECSQHLIRTLDNKGEAGAAALCKKLGGGRAAEAKALAYRLYHLCDRKGWGDEAQAYNRLVISWESIMRQAAGGAARGEQLSFDN